MNKVKKGISFGSVFNCELEELNNLNNLDDLMIEVPAGQDKAVEFLEGLEVKYGIHYPSFTSYQQIGYDWSNKVDRKKIKEDFLTCVEKYRYAEYYLLHFPGNNLSNDKNIQELEYFLENLKSDMKEKSTLLVIENMSHFRVEDYEKIIKNTGVKLCLDLGHAHIIDEREVYQFFDRLANYIRVIHYYNTTNDKTNIQYGVHLPYQAFVENGIDIARVNQLISSISNEIYVINEQIGRRNISCFREMEFDI